MSDEQIVNRGFLTVRPTQLFWDWANDVSGEIEFSEFDDTEPTVYLVEEDFFEIEPILKKAYKRIFENELSSISFDEEVWPKAISFELFLTWFNIDNGSIVVDLEKNDLMRESF